MPALPPPLKTRTPLWFRFLVGGLLCIPVFFLLIALLIVGWRWELKRDVDRQIASLREQGVPLSGEELDTFYPAVPDTNNAAIGITQVFHLLTKYPDDRASELQRFKTPRLLSELSNEDAALLRGYVEMNRAALERVHNAPTLPECRYPIDLREVYETELPHLRQLKQLALLLSYDAILSARSGDVESAARSSAEILALARTLDKEPVLISALVRVALVNIGKESVEMTLNAGQLTQVDLEKLLAKVRLSRNSNVLTRALMGEVGTYLPLFRMSAAELNRLNQINSNGGSPISMPIGGSPHPLLRVTGFMERDLRFFLDAMNSLIERSRMEPPLSLEGTENHEELCVLAARRYHIMSSMLLPMYPRSPSRDAQQRALLACAELALTIDLFRLKSGDLPTELGELVPTYFESVPKDPFDGQPMRYRKLEHGYMLYSIGRDGTDDGGRERPPHSKYSDTNTYDITFIVER